MQGLGVNASGNLGLAIVLGLIVTDLVQWTAAKLNDALGVADTAARESSTATGEAYRNRYAED